MPLGGRIGEGKAQHPVERVAEPTGGQNVAWQPSGSRGQSSGAAVSAAARTGPRVAAQAGVPRRPLVRELVVAEKPRRPRLGGVPHGAAVDEGGVGPRPARPYDPAVSAPSRLDRCRRQRPDSPGRHGSGSNHSCRLPRFASAAWADHSGRHRARAGARGKDYPHALGKRARTGGRTADAHEALVACLSGKHHGGDRERTDQYDDPDRA